MIQKATFFLFAVVLSFSAAAQECLFCGRPETLTPKEIKAETFQVGAQYKYFNRSSQEGDAFFNPFSGQEKVSTSAFNIKSVYDFTDSLSADLNVPIIFKSYSRYTGESNGASDDSSTDFGDINLIGTVRLAGEGKKSDAAWDFRGGVKFPTGNSDELEQEESPDPQFANSLVRGRDIAAGSGSFDFPIGTQVSFDVGNVITYLDAGYIFKLEGESDYKYGNELTGDLGSGYKFELPSNSWMMLGVEASYEHVEEDELSSAEITNSGYDRVNVGPALELNVQQNFTAHISCDFPAYKDYNGAQLVPSHWLNISAIARF